MFIKNSFFFLVVFLVIGNSLYSQLSVQPKSDIKSQTYKNQEGGKYYSEYVVRPEKLRNFFNSGEIPHDFPKYDKEKTFDENKIIAKSWARENKSFIKQEFWYKLED
jgi:hypothetical protein